MYKVKCIERSENNRFALTEGETYIVDENGMKSDTVMWESFLTYEGSTPLEKFLNFCNWVNKDPTRGKLIFEVVPDGVVVRRF